MLVLEEALYVSLHQVRLRAVLPYTSYGARVSDTSGIASPNSLSHILVSKVVSANGIQASVSCALSRKSVHDYLHKSKCGSSAGIPSVK